MLRDNKVNPGKYVKAWGKPETAEDPAIVAFEKNKGKHPYASLHNLSPRFHGGAPNGLTAPV